MCLLVRATLSESHYRAIYLRERTVEELVKCVVTKYGLRPEDQRKVKRAVRHVRGGAVVMQDSDVARMANEMEMVVAVRSAVANSQEWQLEISS